MNPKMKELLAQLPKWLSVLVIPIGVWMTQVEVAQALITERVQKLQAETAAIKETVSGLSITLTEQRLMLVRIEERLDTLHRGVQALDQTLRGGPREVR